MTSKKQIFLKPLLNDLRTMAFPLAYIALYAIFHITSYAILKNYSNFAYFAFIASQMVSSFFAGVLADRVSRIMLLWLCFPIAILEFWLLFNGSQTLALYISPLFCSTTVARAEILYKHGHHSVKNLMCYSFIAIFIVWSFFDWIADGGAKIIWPYALGVVAFFGILRGISRKKQNHDINKNLAPRNVGAMQENKKRFSMRWVWGFLVIGIVFSQANFFSIAEGLESLHMGNRYFTLMGRMCLIGSVFCLFNNGDHKDLIYTSYSYMLMFSFAALLLSRNWNSEAWRVGITLTSGFGGFYLPIITEQIAKLRGKKHYGQSVAIVEILIGGGSMVAGIAVLEDRGSPFLLSLCLVITAVLAVVPYKRFITLFNKHERNNEKKKKSSRKN
ncbi:MAG: hypothetical protein KDK71_08250 [Chlamydiia bacterium]|nr:hypothetical protein [Chlamydiia bacterium]